MPTRTAGMPVSENLQTWVGVRARKPRARAGYPVLLTRSLTRPPHHLAPDRCISQTRITISKAEDTRTEKGEHGSAANRGKAAALHPRRGAARGRGHVCIQRSARPVCPADIWSTQHSGTSRVSPKTELAQQVATQA